MTVLGIDPGSSSGGLAWIFSDGRADAIPMPVTERDIWDAINNSPPETRAVIEAVHSFPGQGVASTFRFGMSYGGLRMALIAAGIPFIAVSPATWTRAMGLPTLKQAGTNTKLKNARKARCQELFPAIKATHAISDALLIASHGRTIQ